MTICVRSNNTAALDGNVVPDMAGAASWRQRCIRYKTIIGRRLHARTLFNRNTEASIGCNVLDRMTRLGMPISIRIK